MIDTMTETANDERRQRLEHIKGELKKLFGDIDALSDHAQEYKPESFPSGSTGTPSKLEFLKEEVIRLTSEVGDEAVEPVGAYYRPGRNVGLVEQAQGKIEALVKLVEEHKEGEPNQFSIPWIAAGCKKEVPRCACLVGHYRGCGCDCYAWVMPQRAKTFRDFVLIVLSLVPQEANEALPTPSGVGAANSPNF